MGRRYFYAIVDETHRRLTEQNQSSVGSWDGYERNAWYQRARQKTGRKPMTRQT